MLRTMLREFSLVPTSERDERWHSRGITNAPAKGGLAIVRRRATRARRSRPRAPESGAPVRYEAGLHGPPGIG